MIASRQIRPGLLWRLLLILLVTAVLTLTYLLLSLDGLQADTLPLTLSELPSTTGSRHGGHEPLPADTKVHTNHLEETAGGGAGFIGTPENGGVRHLGMEAQEVEYEGTRWARIGESINSAKTSHQGVPDAQCNCSRHSANQITAGSDVNIGDSPPSSADPSLANPTVKRPNLQPVNVNGFSERLVGRFNIETGGGGFSERGQNLGMKDAKSKNQEALQKVQLQSRFRTDTKGKENKLGNTGRHINFYLPIQMRQNFAPSHIGSSLPTVSNSHEELDLRIRNRSRQLREIVLLLEQIKKELNHSSAVYNRDVPAHLKTSITAAEQLITSLVFTENDLTKESSDRRLKFQNADGRSATKQQPPVSNFMKSTTQEVFCKETFKGTLYGYPFYEKGFVEDACPEQTRLDRLLTVALNFVDYPPQQLQKDAPRLVRQFRKMHPSVTVLVAVRRSSAEDQQQQQQQQKIHFEANFVLGVNEDAIGNGGGVTASRPAAVWNALIARVTTPYVFIAHQITHVDVDSSVKRLLREISKQNLGAVGGATRTADGRWTMGCHQVAHRNYSLTYRHGYRRSQHECLRCNYVDGPFVTRTDLLRRFPLDESLSTPTIFPDYFLTLREKGIAAALCADVMFHTRFPDNRVLQHKSTWTPMAAKWRLNRIRLASAAAGSEGVLHTFTCAEVRMDCAFTTGLAVAPCCLELLAEQIKFIMRTCESNRIICELQEGTLLGAVKLGKVLPWERDGDITFLSTNFSALAALEGQFRAAGYILQKSGDTRCCVEERLAGGVFSVKGVHTPWTVEMYGYHKTDSEQLLSKGLHPTKVFFDGAWVASPRNPGLLLRNRYGHEIYRHAQHWISLGKYNGWEEYTPSGFSPCPIPGRHDCLDAYSVDGNLQFVEPVP